MNAREPALSARPVLEPELDDAAFAQRHVILRDLVILGHVGIEVILAIELREARNLGTKGETGLDRQLDRRLVRNRQCSGQTETNRTDFRVRFAAKLVLAPAKHLRLRFKLNVTLKPNDSFVFCTDAFGRYRHDYAFTPMRGECFLACNVARSYACAAPNRSRSPKRGAVSCKPSGISASPSSGFAQPQGTEIEGRPASETGIV